VVAPSLVWGLGGIPERRAPPPPAVTPSYVWGLGGILHDAVARVDLFQCGAYHMLGEKVLDKTTVQC
jgi:hypothetical protein